MSRSSVVSLIGSAVRGRRRELALWSAPFAIAAAFTLLLIATFGSIVQSIYEDSDIVSLPLFGQLYPAAPGDAHVVVGFGGWYTGLGLELLTRFLPFHRELWEVGPWIVSLAAVGLVAWSVTRAAGRRAGALVAFTLVCAGPLLLPLQFAWAKHGATTAHACLLGAFLVFLVERKGRIGGRATHLGVSTAVGALTAIGAASDQMMFPSGVVPFVIAGAVLMFLLPTSVGRRIGLTVFGIGALALIGSRIVVAAMEARHIRPVHLAITFVAWDHVGPNLVGFVQSLAGLFNADFGGSKPDGRSVLAFACAVIAIAGAVIATRTAKAWAREAARRIATGTRDDSNEFGARAAVLTFWWSAIILTTASFVLSSVGSTNSSRYLMPVAYGMTVLVAVAASAKGPRYVHIAFLGASVIAAASVVSLAARDLQPDPADRNAAKEILALAQSENVTYGYAEYWDAARLTWLMHGRVQLYPIVPCSAPQGLCQFPYNTISSWFTPRPGTRTLLVVDPRYGVNDPKGTLGGPHTSITSGHYTVLVYDYDIASNVGPAPAWTGN